jgi:4-aminobutyrate aminotransferase
MGGRLADVWFRSTDLDVVSGAGCWVTTTDGTRYLDGTSGIAVTSTGHCHPQVVAAIQEQAARFIHAQVNVYRHDLLARLADRLEQVTPPGIDTFFLSNSGAEATEGAVKLAKQATGRPHVVVVDGSFHGRTHLAMAMTTSKYSYRAGHAPLPAGVYVTPFPTGDDDVARCLAGFDRLLATQTAPSETAAVVIEPVLGEGGYRPAPAAFLLGLVERCRAHGILFVADEVQTGFARTGTMFAVDRFAIEPDVLVMAKGIASGFPLSAIGASAQLMDRWPTGSHGGTYGGNPIGCAAALATIDVLTAPGFLDAVEARGEQLRAGLRELAAADPGLVDVRGPGLMVGVDLVHADGGAPDGARAAAVVRHCQTEGRLLLMTAGTAANTVRWMFPLVVEADEIAFGLEAFGAALAATR